MVNLESDTGGIAHTLAGLAKGLAAIATSMRQQFVEQYSREAPQGPLHVLVSSKLAILVQASDVADLGDQVAQTITCGLATLLAISGFSSSFTPEVALEHLPATHPFLRDFFGYFLGGILKDTPGKHDFLPARLVSALGIPDLFRLLDVPWVGQLFQAPPCTAGNLNPTIQLYETFLHAYNTTKRAQRGVFYTPDALVSFIIRAVDTILWQECGCPMGLRDPNAGNILDPATGTGTFFRQVIPTIGHQFPSRAWGCEVLLAPFIIAHILLGKGLEETGFSLAQGHRLGIYLANALDVGWPACPGARPQSTLDQLLPKTAIGESSTPHESDVARDAMQRVPFHVIVGNPPYARKSQNVGKAIMQYMQSYKTAVQEERNIQALADDYLKFLRLAEVLIERAGWGVVGFVLNNRFLTGPIYRGVRESLITTFNLLYVLNLHGGKKGYEQLPVEPRDENVFPIAQGVCICLLVKRPGSPQTHAPQIFYHELLGSRVSKLDALAWTNLNSIPWTLLPTTPPGSPFVPDPVPPALRAEWEIYSPLEQLFSFCNVRGKPGDDELLVSLTRDEVLPQIESFITHSKTAKSQSDIPLTEAKRKILRQGDELSLNPTHIEPYLYRPFDIRWVYYDRYVWTRAVPSLKAHCRGTLLLLCAKIVIDPVWAHVLATTTFPDVILLSNSTSVNCYVFPVQVTDKESGALGWNLTQSFQAYLHAQGINFDHASDADVLAYPYAILWSRSYRTRYDHLLRDGHFPRIPLVTSRELFNQLSALGHRLLELHADRGRSAVPSDILTNVRPGARILPGFPRFQDGAIYISPSETFAPVSEDVWNFVVGKYGVCQQWLAARMHIALAGEDITRFLQILGIIQATIAIMREIDHAISSAGGFPITILPPGSNPATDPPLRKPH